MGRQGYRSWATLYSGVVCTSGDPSEILLMNMGPRQPPVWQAAPTPPLELECNQGFSVGIQRQGSPFTPCAGWAHGQKLEMLCLTPNQAGPNPWALPEVEAGAEATRRDTSLIMALG